MADDRRIITGTHVVAKEGNIMEDTGVHKYIIDTTVGKTLGGKSIVTDVADTQDFAGGNAWYQGDNKSTALAITGVTKPTGTTTADTGDVQFLYVRNLDTTNDIYISLTTDQTWDGEWSDGVGQIQMLVIGNRVELVLIQQRLPHMMVDGMKECIL